MLFVSMLGQVQADTGTEHISQVSVEYLKGAGRVQGLRLAYRPSEYHFATLPILGDANLYWEASTNFWQYGQPSKYQSNVVLALSPVLKKQFANWSGKPVFWELGVGVSVLTKREFAGKDLGSYFQFEDRLGLLIGLDQQSSKMLAIRYMHYSNAGLSNRNPGMDFLNIAYSWRF
ncbi:acyloxyacyl hydrolase [Alkalimonas collagenimarina]|uniref:Lipid A deacylase n=1 Tax=Alkalimonas collagenimarina TaxID=400390 RepID=A0ABT9GVL5_9GAMM|nr:acyloxyacyl hydrolase [Alkalimonas collagenimarina]MDP4534760.1 acyloxyacyl hydrolase [Alkalimonas collagenimarina]